MDFCTTHLRIDQATKYVQLFGVVILSAAKNLFSRWQDEILCCAQNDKDHAKGWFAAEGLNILICRINALSSTNKQIKGAHMSASIANQTKDGEHCEVVAGTHKGKSGTVRDINISKTGHMTITVVQKSGVRFKTLAKNVVTGRKA